MSRKSLVPLVALSLSLTALSLTACAGQSPASAEPTPGRSIEPLTVFAAASLTDVLTTIGTNFEREAGTPAAFSFGGSADLVAQLQGGAPADLLATADEATMTKARDAGVVTAEPTVFATNTLTIAVPPGKPHGIASLADLAEPGRLVVICAVQVPCGATTAAVAQDAGVTLTPVSEENSVTDVLGKVSSGEADAGVVWSTDIGRSQGRVERVDFPEADKRPSRYLIAPVASSTRTDDAQRFIDYVTSSPGQQVLGDAGFRTP